MPSFLRKVVGDGKRIVRKQGLMARDGCRSACCQPVPPPASCECDVTFIPNDCLVGQGEVCCPCHGEFDWNFQAQYLHTASRRGYDYGWFFSPIPPYQRIDWTDDIAFTFSDQRQIEIHLHKRCVNGQVVFDYNGSHFHRVLIQNGVTTTTDLHDAAAAAQWQFGPFAGDPLTVGAVDICGVVENPLAFLFQGSPFRTRPIERPPCTGSYLNNFGPDPGNGCFPPASSGFVGYNWHGASRCDSGETGDSGEYFFSQQCDQEEYNFGRHIFSEDREAEQGSASWTLEPLSNCIPDPCAGTQPKTGACCGLFDPFNQTVPCRTATQSYCVQHGGAYQGDNTVCATANCPAVGACCLPNGGCVQDTQSRCSLIRHGVYKGDGTICLPGVCPPITGACCLGTSCQQTNKIHCRAIGGIWLGLGSACNPNPCLAPPPTGACCARDGSCTQTTAADCASTLGTYQGDGILCSNVFCPVTIGACCIDNGLPTQRCFDGVTFEECVAKPGGTSTVWEQLPATCASLNCGPAPAPAGFIPHASDFL